jgi:hypothetical protein
MYSTEIQSLIDDAESALANARTRVERLGAEAQHVREEISQLESELRAVYDEGMHEKLKIQSIIHVNRLHSTSIDGPDWAQQGIREIEASTGDALTFAQAQLARLDSVMAESAESDPSSTSVYVRSLSVGDSASRDARALPLGVGSDMERAAETPRSLVSVVAGAVTLTPLRHPINTGLVVESKYEFEVGEKRGAIPYRIFSLTDPDSLEIQNPEELGVRVTAEMLAAEGRPCIIALGGPGKPDILSLDGVGKLWMTEVKGSFKGTPLARAGLLRTLKPDTPPELAAADPLTGTLKVWENSPEWLRRSGVDVLKSLTMIERTVDDAELRTRIHELTLRYAQAVTTGFEEEDYCTEIFQVGALAGSESLPYLDPNPTLHAYCADVEPTRITQVTTGEEAVI